MCQFEDTPQVIIISLPVEEDSWNVNIPLISHPSHPNLNSQSFQHLPCQNLQFPHASDRLPYSSCEHEFLHYLQYCSWVCECNPQGWLAMSYLQRSLCQPPVLEYVHCLYCAMHNFVHRLLLLSLISHISNWAAWMKGPCLLVNQIPSQRKRESHWSFPSYNMHPHPYHTHTETTKKIRIDD